MLPDATWEQRAAELKVLMPDAADAERFAHVICDGCGKVVEVDYGKPELPVGWVTWETGEFCAECVKG
jgi:hypothetical protein